MQYETLESHAGATTAELRHVRCRCGKILCQTAVDTQSRAAEPPPAELRAASTIVIKCRHCKRYLALRVDQIAGVRFVDDPSQL